MKLKYLVLALLIINSTGIINGEIKDISMYKHDLMSHNCQTFDIISLTENKVLIGFMDQSYNLYGLVGTHNNTNITYGAPYFIADMGCINPISLIKINENKVLITYGVHGSVPPTIQTVICTINDYSLSYSNNYSFISDIEYVDTLLLSSSKFALIYTNTTNAYITIGTIIGDTIIYGDHYYFGHAPEHLTSGKINENCFIVTYGGNAFIVNELNTNLIFGSVYTFSTGGTWAVSSDMIDNNNCMISYLSDNHPNSITSIIGNIIGDTIIFGNEYVYSVYHVDNCNMQLFDSLSFVIMYKDYLDINYVLGNITNGDITYYNDNNIYTEIYSIWCPNLAILNKYSYIGIFSCWGASGADGYGVLWYDINSVPIIDSNTTSTNHTKTFDNLFSDLSVWGFLIVIFAAFENECGNDLFWLIIIMIPFTMTWIKQKSVIIPSILALLCGGILFTLIPESAIAPIKILLTIGIAGIFYHIIKSR